MLDKDYIKLKKQIKSMKFYTNNVKDKFVLGIYNQILDEFKNKVIEIIDYNSKNKV
jgi:hypothetical protein